MTNKLIKFRDYLNDKLNDTEFKKYYEEEGKKLEIGYKIAKLRHKRGLTQKGLAKKIHSSQTAVSRLERGDYWSCSIRTLEKIALATGTHLNITFGKQHPG